MKNTLDARKKFLESARFQDILEFFDHAPDVYFWVKDKDGRYMANNFAGVMRKKCKKESDVLLKTDKDFFSKKASDSFSEDDRQIINNGQKIIDKSELIPSEGGNFEWHRTTKAPLRDRDGEIIGIIGMTINLKKSGQVLKEHNELTNVLHYISQHHQNTIELKTLAEMMGISISQLERKFKKKFNITPLKYIIKVRVHSACRLLEETNLSISEIASRTGFCNPGALTNTFKIHMNMLPKDYRKKQQLTAASLRN